MVQSYVIFFKYQNIFYPIYKQKVALLKNDNKKLTKNDPEETASRHTNCLLTNGKQYRKIWKSYSRKALRQLVWSMPTW